MSWVRRTETTAPAHTCAPPMGEVWMPDGERGDLWRCDDCDALWQIASVRHAGLSSGCSLAWQPATWWQRLRYRRVGVFDAEEDALRRELTKEDE